MWFMIIKTFLRYYCIIDSLFETFHVVFVLSDGKIPPSAGWKSIYNVGDLVEDFIYLVKIKMQIFWLYFYIKPIGSGIQIWLYG